MTEKRYTYLDASRNKYIGSFFCNGKPLTNDEVADLLNEQDKEIKSLKEELKDYSDENASLEERIIELENKLNQTALEFLNHEIISMGKAVEISEMSYYDFTKYSADVVMWDD